jgi:hypothetical protein
MQAANQVRSFGHDLSSRMVRSYMAHGVRHGAQRRSVIRSFGHSVIWVTVFCVTQMTQKQYARAKKRGLWVFGSFRSFRSLVLNRCRSTHAIALQQYVKYITSFILSLTHDRNDRKITSTGFFPPFSLCHPPSSSRRTLTENSSLLTERKIFVDTLLYNPLHFFSLAYSFWVNHTEHTT